jgi:limonene-1,2-epoxide hydrolase
MSFCSLGRLFLEGFAMSQRVEVVRGYFEAQNRGDAEAVVALFAEDATVHNAALPPVKGHSGVRGFCQNLYARTSSRRFEVLEVLEKDSVVLAEWQARMTFQPGAVVGPHTLAKGFDVELRGVNKFEFQPGSDSIATLRVFHETTSVARLAAENAVKS